MAFYNSKQYSWADYSIVYGGRIIEGVVGFEYNEKQEKGFLYGRGSNPHDILHANKSYEGKLKIWQSELEAMTKDAPDNDILKLRFDVVGAFAPKDGGQTVVDACKDVEITEIPKAFSQGDKNMIVELPVIFLSVARQQ